MGVPWEDSAAVGNLLGIKMTVNEFVAYGFLGEAINNGSIGLPSQPMKPNPQIAAIRAQTTGVTTPATLRM